MRFSILQTAKGTNKKGLAEAGARHSVDPPSSDKRFPDAWSGNSNYLIGDSAAQHR